MFCCPGGNCVANVMIGTDISAYIDVERMAEAV